MEITFSRDYKHNYLVIKDERVLEDNYQLKMLWKNNPEGTVVCNERMINGEGLLYYDVTSRQSFKNIYEFKPIELDDIRMLFTNIKRTCENLSKFLLYGSQLILEPEYIFMNMETNEYYFIFYPYYENENSMMSVLSFIMERLNPNDMEATKAVYELTDMLERKQCSMEEAIGYFLDEYQKEEEMEPVVFNEMTNDDKYDYSYLDEEPVEEESFFKRLINKIFKKHEKASEEENYDWTENFYEESNDTHSSEGTVYIPWTENGENKLYGMGKNNKYHIDLTKGSITVGKLAGNVDMVINDNSISRMHAKFFKKGNTYFMSDLNSTNGSFINGRRLNPNETCPIEAGDEIGLGRLKFIYR